MNNTRIKDYASVSFGKDSLAMLFMLIEKGYPLDEVVFYDTGMEFQAIYTKRLMNLTVLKRKIAPIVFFLLETGKSQKQRRFSTAMIKDFSGWRMASTYMSY